MHQNESVYPYVFGLAATGAGIVADVISGLSISEDQVWRGVSLHLLAVLIWMIGMSILKGRHPGNPDAPARGQADRLLDGETSMALVIGLLLFPGLGTLGCSLAFGISALFKGKGRREADTHEQQRLETVSEISRAVEMFGGPLDTLDVQPLSDVVDEADSRIKRAALDLICREPGPEAMSLARRMLADQDADVRALAAVAVSRIDSAFSAQLKQALSEIESAPLDAQNHAAAGDIYIEYAPDDSGAATNRSSHLAQARKFYEQAVHLEPDRHEYWLSLAEVLVALGDSQKAGDALAWALAAFPADSSGYVLAMENAFRTKEFDRVVAYAEQACRALPAADEAMPLMRWWLEAKSRGEVEPS